MAGKKRKRRRKEPGAAELNIMPFIDIFSMLNTFLLVSAAFINLGILEVQVPFMTSAPPDKSKPQRQLNINVDVAKDKVTVTTTYSMPPDDKKTFPFEANKKGFDEMHAKMLELRQKYPESDKVTLFSEDDVKYATVVDAVDAIKTLREKDPKFSITDEKTGVKKEAAFVFEKVVFGSVIL